MIRVLISGSSVHVQALAGDITFFLKQETFITLTVPLLTQVYKWVLENLMVEGGSNPVMDWHPMQGGVQIL